ncbi:hydroxyethylthiazole kinase [Treponema sp.]|uniref:hydroxyethylthiazole kinase n=1 Tax=Treponema sp. TaxID=166 RepID=UPI00388DA899
MTESQIKSQIVNAVKEVHSKKPLAPSITNTVTIDFVANAQIAVGGSAAMVYLPDEGDFIAEAGSAVYINAGTMLPVYEQTLPRTAKRLFELKKNWVLDPVAIGIGSLRTKLLAGFKDYPPSIVRGNASEVIALAKLWEVDGSVSSNGPKGVDSVDSVKDAENAAKALAKYIYEKRGGAGGAVAVSGVEDLVTDGETVVYSKGGSHFMEKITGSGCSLGGVCAVYAGVTSPFIAALTATQIYNLAGKRAEARVNAPASFQTAFLDELYLASAEDAADNPFEVK